MTPDPAFVDFNCVEVSQPIGVFYVGAMPASDVLAISYSDVRRISERDIEQFSGIQRELNPRRVKEISQYVTNVDATFPTAVILAVAQDDVQFDRKRNRIQIRRDKSVAQIIDGQHRIAGLQDFDGQFDLNVTLFVDMDIQDRAMTFATINLAQTKVSRSLVYDLYAFQKARSPIKTCHQIARLLNRESDSPLEGRIKILGRAMGEPFQNITQAAFVESLVQYVSDNPDRDRDALRRGRALPKPPDSKIEKLVFRDWFAEKEDAKIAMAVSNLFDAVAQRWPEAWDAEATGMILNRTTGFRAVMRLLGPLYRESDSSAIISTKAILGRLEKVRIKDNDLNRERYKPGSSGEVDLYRALATGMKL